MEISWKLVDFLHTVNKHALFEHEAFFIVH